MLSLTAGYALNAVIHIARTEDEERAVPAADVAEALDVPPNYLSKILWELSKAELLVSGRGRKGGFRLARPAREIRLLDVVERFDEMGPRRQCLLGRGYCSEVGHCPAHDEWREASAPAYRFFETRTVADLM